MQDLNFKLILLAVALVYGATTVSAIPVPVGESSIAARSDVYDDLDLNAREIANMGSFTSDSQDSDNQPLNRKWWELLKL